MMNKFRFCLLNCGQKYISFPNCWVQYIVKICGNSTRYRDFRVDPPAGECNVSSPSFVRQSMKLSIEEGRIWSLLRWPRGNCFSFHNKRGRSCKQQLFKYISNSCSIEVVRNFVWPRCFFRHGGVVFESIYIVVVIESQPVSTSLVLCFQGYPVGFGKLNVWWSGLF